MAIEKYINSFVEMINIARVYNNRGAEGANPPPPPDFDKYKRSSYVTVML